MQGFAPGLRARGNAIRPLHAGGKEFGRVRASAGPPMTSFGPALPWHDPGAADTGGVPPAPHHSMRVPGPRALAAFWVAVLTLAGGGAGILHMLGPPESLPRAKPAAAIDAAPGPPPPTTAQAAGTADGVVPPAPVDADRRDHAATAWAPDGGSPLPVEVALLLPLAGRRLDIVRPQVWEVTAPVAPPVVIPALPDWAPPGAPASPPEESVPRLPRPAALALAALPGPHPDSLFPLGPALREAAPFAVPVVIHAPLPLIPGGPEPTDGIAAGPAAFEPSPLAIPPGEPPSPPSPRAPAVPEPAPVIAPADPPQPADPIRTAQIPEPPAPREEAEAEAAPLESAPPAANPEAGPKPMPAEGAPAPSTAADAPREDRAAMAVEPDRPPPAAATAAAPAPAAPPSLPPAMVAALLRRGEAMLAEGDISAARLLFERAARGGSGAAALALGRSHDPRFLAALGVRGLRADPEAAARWYEHASALGEAEATRLRQGLALATPPNRGQAPAAEERRP